MPVCSYVVVPRPGRTEALRADLSGLPGCDVASATNAELLLLVTTTSTFEDDVRLRSRVEGLPGIQALLMTFGEVDPETPVGDPLSVGRRRLPVVSGPEAVCPRPGTGPEPGRSDRDGRPPRGGDQR